MGVCMLQILTHANILFARTGVHAEGIKNSIPAFAPFITTERLAIVSIVCFE